MRPPLCLLHILLACLHIYRPGCLATVVLTGSVPNPRTMIVRALFLTFLLAERSSGQFVVTGACDSDSDCQTSGHGGCCARWNPSASTNVCKELGNEGDLCHVAASQLPFPFSGRRRFWRCPCGDDMTCVPSSPGSMVGACE
ncbi:PREDICTED: toxin MIT1-like [Branchiostoma belcheri]|uniref:Toxin MIT1-like n=1 Tax=Branchiostoma belcheri TaxID=7741 RepID=A0A6P5A023_BRABE|nr:PREDICTED: toxin MIT1-like [Branchiostoma belcheri]